MALRSLDALLRCLFLFSYLRVATCLAIPALMGGCAVPPKSNPLLVTFPVAAPTAGATSTADPGEKDTGHANGSPTAPSLTDFQEFVQRRESRACKVLLDLRPWGDFCRGHPVGATSIPVDELEPRLLELPPPFASPIKIMGDEEELRSARELLTRKGWRIETEIVSDARKMYFNDWSSQTEIGSYSVQVWRANDFLEFCMERYLSPFASERGHRLGPALDLGCGSGRDTVYMAQHLPPGARIIGVDNHSYALERGARLADKWVDAAQAGDGGGSKRQDGSAIVDTERLNLNIGPWAINERRACEWLLADLRKAGSLDDLKAHVIHGHRFKCEQLLPLLRDQVLLPGGFFIWSTFLDTGTENAVPPWRPSRMLRPGELANIFSGDDFEILVDEHGELSTRGSAVPANFFACRKRPDVEQPSR